ncbi:glycogenin-2-like isoform X6 [Aricia agestis]|uniref:glycogenin-2-like isoform X6 n=1 Tax=Aricia agestis TaxID=91739 RepID=UPI001C206C02|nr:glycogenin-2-like isoform X6 [Aricia agestis]
MSNRAWVTLATNDSYGLGALVLAHSLRRAGSAVPAVVLITPSVTDAMRERLGAVFAEVITVDVLDSGDAAHLALLQRPELGITFTKLHCWNLTQYEKCVFLDADTLIVQNCDELFDREELSAAPDVGWPDCFNSGVFVFRPSAETFSNIIKFAQERGSFDGGDQGLLNLYFSDWAHGDINKHLPFLYNVTSAAFYSYLPALKQYGRDLKIIHFIGASKPWLQHYNWRTHTVDAPDHLREFLQLWWSLFTSEVHTKLDSAMTGVAGHLARIGEDLQSEAIDELSRRQGWEAGNIDYMGADSFDKIWAKISQTLSQGPSSPPKQQSPPLAQPSVGGKDASPLKESPPAPASAPKDLPKEEPQPVPVETSTEKSTPTEPLPASKDTEQKVDVIPSEPVEPVTKELAQPESLPVQIKTDATTLATEETSPQTLERNTEVKAPSEACVPNPTEQSVPLPIEPEKVETQPQDLAKAPEAEPKTLPSESLPKPVEAESKTSPTEDKPAEVEKKELPSETIPAPVEAVDKALPAEVAPTPVESEPKAKQDIVPPKTTEADAMEQIPVPEPTKTEVATSEEKTETVSDIPVSGLEALKLDDKAGASDSPLLATTPSKDEAPAAPAAKSEERRKLEKLQLHPPAAADPLPTPDSELEDAASLAQSIIAIELRTTVTSPSPTTEPSPKATPEPRNLLVEGPEVPTPPVGAVSLSQIGIKPKSKPTTAAQIESSVSKVEVQTPPTPTEDPKKKLVKKVVKKEAAPSGEAPVPPPRKKEKKPKDK